MPRVAYGAKRGGGGDDRRVGEGETTDEASLEPYGLAVPVALLHLHVAELWHDTRSFSHVCAFLRTRVCCTAKHPVCRTRPRCKHFLLWPRSADRNVGDKGDTKLLAIARKKWHAPLCVLLSVVRTFPRSNCDWKWQWTSTVTWTNHGS